MANQYECRACALQLTLGGYHGGNCNELWIVGLCCRHCGTPHRLEQPLATALAAWRSTPAHPTTPVLRGPHGAQEVPAGGEVPATVACQTCGATGPLGSAGPLTDGSSPGAPPGSAPSPDALWARVASGQGQACAPGAQACPRCKELALQYLGELIT